MIIIVDNKIIGSDVKIDAVEALTMDIDKTVTIKIKRESEELTFSYNPKKESFNHALNRITLMIKNQKDNTIKSESLKNYMH